MQVDPLKYTTRYIPYHRQLASNNTITSLKLLMCTRAMLKELAKCSKLKSLEIIEASVIQDSDLAEFSHGNVALYNIEDKYKPNFSR